MSRYLWLCLFLVIVAFAGFVQSASGTAMQFTVPSGQEILRPLELAVDDHVLVKFTVVGQTGNTVNFTITDPHGNAMIAFGDVGNVNYSFVCTEEGEYHLHFSNAASSEDKLVTLDCEIQHYIFGIPQMLFLALIIVVVCVGAVAVFILMGKPR